MSRLYANAHRTPGWSCPCKVELSIHEAIVWKKLVGKTKLFQTLKIKLVIGLWPLVSVHGSGALVESG